MFYFLDFEGYKYGGESFVVKELAILSSDWSQCFTYFIKSPNNVYPSWDSTLAYQFNRHKLGWNIGDFHFRDAIARVKEMTIGCLIYVKGDEKQRFLEMYFNHVEQLNMLPSIKTLSSCRGEECENQHGKYCARRKVHEFKKFLDDNQIKLSSQIS